jgi:7-alpha-hydroxysteroid dehydrogenase
VTDLQQFRLDGKVAIVVGGGRGIGEGIARTFADAGASLALVSRTAEQAQSVADDLTATGTNAIVVPTDVNDLAALPNIVDRTVAELGGVDVVVYSAGGGYEWRHYPEMTVEDLERSFHFNVAVPFELSRLAVPHLLERPGASIINITSITTKWALRGHLVYEVAKAGLNQLTRSLSADLGPRIRVNAILPNAVETPSLKQVFDDNPGMRDSLNDLIRLRRTGTPADIGNAALYLASEAGSWVTGVLLEVSGGPVDSASQFPDL